jgi:DNA invertase Pin-like site-specific DNA recombinase
MNVGYLRSSAPPETLSEDFTSLERAGCVRIVLDDATASPAARSPVLQALIERLADGDTLVVCSFESVASSLQELVGLVLMLDARNVRFRSIRERFDFSKNRTVLKAVFEQLQDFHNTVQERRPEYPKTRLGRRIGRPRSLGASEIAKARDLLAQGHTIDEIAKQLRVSRATLYRHLEED